VFESNKPARIPNAMEATDRISWIKPLTKQRAASIITTPAKNPVYCTHADSFAHSAIFVRRS